MVGYVKWSFQAFKSDTRNMNSTKRDVYYIILQELYISDGRLNRDDLRWLYRESNHDRRTFKRYFDQLADDKIIWFDDRGRIRQKRADQTLEDIGINRDGDKLNSPKTRETNKTSGQNTPQKCPPQTKGNKDLEDKPKKPKARLSPQSTKLPTKRRKSRDHVTWNDTEVGTFGAKLLQKCPPVSNKTNDLTNPPHTPPIDRKIECARLPAHAGAREGPPTPAHERTAPLTRGSPVSPKVGVKNKPARYPKGMTKRQRQFAEQLSKATTPEEIAKITANWESYEDGRKKKS